MKVGTEVAVIKVIHGNPERMAPLVGYFPSGFDPDPNSTNVGVFRHKQRGGTRLQLVVIPDKDAKVDFVANSYAGEAQAGEYCSYGLGIFDKATRTLKIANSKVFRLEPKVQGIDSSNDKPASSVIGELSEHEKAEKRIQLHNLYGTKKSIRKNKKMQMSERENDPDAHNDLDVIKQCMMTTEDLLEASEGHMVCNTPPFNASATTPQEAYPLDKIISTGDEDKKNKLTCIFSYIMHLIKFNDLHSKERHGHGIPSEKASSAKAHRFPGIIRDKFASMFDAVSGSLSTKKRNLLISYVLVLTLFADEFQTSLTDKASDLRMKSPDLRKHYEAARCLRRITC
ncbi:hypothetical protein ACLB2K_016437 [Fragaria x ananassa]